MTATITVHGGLTELPELKFTSSGKPFLSGTVASTDRYLDKQTNEWRDGKKLYARFTVWGDLANNIAQSGLAKGTQVSVTGKLHTREYQDRDGNPRSSVEMELSDFAVSLRRATVQVTRSQDGQGGSRTSGGAGTGTQSGGGFSSPQNGGWDDREAPF